MAELTQDRFLGGRLSVWQPRAGYRAGVDAVFLAAAVPARPGETVLELGCGVGVASLCLARRVPGVILSGIEVQPDYAELARRNATDNGIALSVTTGDLTRMPEALRQQSFDHVIANPPYFLRDRSTQATDTGRETALGEGTPLASWIEAAIRRLAPKGCLTMIQRADRVPEILAALDDRMGGIQLLPLAPRAGRQAKLVLLRAVKGARAPFALLPPVALHAGETHRDDAKDYARQIDAVLREAAAFPWSDA